MTAPRTLSNQELADLLREAASRIESVETGEAEPAIQTKPTITEGELAKALELHDEWLENPASGQRADLSGYDLSGLDLSGVDLSGADLTGAYLTDAILNDTVLTGAVLTDAVLTGTDLFGADLSEAILTNTTF